MDFISINVIYYRLLNNDQELKLDVPIREKLNRVIKRFHNEISHPGINSTKYAIQQQYTWVGMYSDIKNCVCISLK